MALNILAAFWALSFLFVITPGVDWAYAISAGTRGKVVIPAVSGLLLGHLIATMVVAAGIGALVSSNPIAMTIIIFIGAFYLIWIGVNLIIKPSTPSEIAVQASDSSKSWFKKGIFVSGLNPKVFLLFLALLPQFTDPTSSWSISTQIVILGLIHIFSSAIVYFIVSYGAQAVLKSRPVAARMVSKVSGGFMIMIALLLLSEQVFS